MTMDVRASSSTHRLIPRDPKVYSWILTSLVLRKLELVTIGEQTQNLTIYKMLYRLIYNLLIFYLFFKSMLLIILIIKFIFYHIYYFNYYLFN